VSATLVLGERVVLIDRKQRRYLLTLTKKGEFHSHAGFVRHDDIVGRDEGTNVVSSGNESYLMLRPTLADFVLQMPRGAQVIYPKDLGPILMLADIGPGQRVFESGVGSGALSMAMLRCGAIITGYELREDFANRAQTNVRSFLGDDAMKRYDVQLRDAYEGIDERNFDRIVLDLPEPWNVIPAAVQGALRTGGIFLAYTPTITQAARTKVGLDRAGFASTGTTEVLERTWHIEDQSVRPDHRMVAHTGFLTYGRRVAAESIYAGDRRQRSVASTDSPTDEVEVDLDSGTTDSATTAD
jgi:tRNA (adenine57-N1/adenine58-N1)-methyltransferase catalytic subunit